MRSAVLGIPVLGIAALAIATTGCANNGGASNGGASNGGASNGGAAGSPSPTHVADSTFAVTSTDFADGGVLPESTKANAFGDQCKGDNLNPELSWAGAPEGTVAFAITVIDISAGNFVHWTKADIPATTAEVRAGGADALAGVGGQTGNSSGTYFGPCPPGPDHQYVFTVYALDATLGLDANFGIGDLSKALEGHTLAEASIAGLASKSPS